MSLSPTYPGVYVVELPNPVRTIIGVKTSVAAFIGRTKRGPIKKPIIVQSFDDFVRTFGGLWKYSNLSYALYQYYLNGGKEAIIIRVVDDEAIKSTFELGKIKLEAASPGIWGDDLEMEIKIKDAVNPDLQQIDKTVFQLKISLFEYNKKGQRDQEKNLIRQEIYQNLSADENQKRYYVKVLTEESDLVNVIQQTPTPPPEAPPEGPFQLKDKGDDGKMLVDDNITDEDSGLGLLKKVDIFNMLCIPPFDGSSTTSKAVYEAALVHCINRRAMLIVDPPEGWNDADQAVEGIRGTSFMGRHKNAAVFFPMIIAPDPLNDNKNATFVPCGVVAGVMARTDVERGIWKTAAGMEAILFGVNDLFVKLNDDENGKLNPIGINCLRSFPDVGRVIWGGRTLVGADILANEWKYIAVRRTALYIEESLYRGTQWVVFEPNDERLWARIRLNVGAFMQDLFRKGAFQGTDPKKAYFVKCDSSTTTQYDIDRGIVNIIIGFAPLKPAEFVFLLIQQITQQEATT
jgi:phage tail sheath protein FI